MSKRTHELQRNLQTLSTSYYKDFLQKLQENPQVLEGLTDIAHFVANLDVQCTHAMNAFDFRYTKPILKNTSKSYARMTDLRHPIIERIQDTCEYVSNSIHLGDDTQGMDGLLLYGMNAAGKSSLMKSVGLAIVMAQSGMFVPCSAFELSPYTHLFTRISTKDNLFAGMSTFVVEMTELRNILQQSNENSLVLGDELCAGTESISAISIVAAGILELAKRRSSFIFATHLHDLVRLEPIQQLKNIGIQHLHVAMDATGKLIYDRTLRDGNGSETYGLEVCKSLRMPGDFLHVADTIRRQLLNVNKEVVRSKPSRYNRKIYLDACHNCGSTTNLETHHITPQQLANEHGFLTIPKRAHMHKNHRSNLQVLCSKCHDLKHTSHTI